MSLPRALLNELTWDHAFPLSGLYTWPADATAPTIPVFEGRSQRGKHFIRAVGFYSSPVFGEQHVVFDPKWTFSGRVWNRVVAMRNTRKNRAKLKREIAHAIALEERFDSEGEFDEMRDMLSGNFTMADLQEIRMEIAQHRTFRSYHQLVEVEERDVARRRGEDEVYEPRSIIPIKLTLQGLQTMVCLYEDRLSNDNGYHIASLPLRGDSVVYLRETDGVHDYGPTYAVLQTQVKVATTSGPPLIVSFHLNMEDVIADSMGRLIVTLTPCVDSLPCDSGHSRGHRIRASMEIEDEDTGETETRHFQIPVERVLGHMVLFDHGQYFDDTIELHELRDLADEMI